MTLQVILRTCDRASLQSNRIVDKAECVRRCASALVEELQGHDYQLVIIDDGSSQATVAWLQGLLRPQDTLIQHPPVDQPGLSPKQRSRATVKVAYDLIRDLPPGDLVYLVEDDYLHVEGAITTLLEAHRFFSGAIPEQAIAIFPQDFNQLAWHPSHPFNSTYVRPCLVLAGPDRYYRTSWFSHETFLAPVSLLHRYREDFERLLEIGTVDGAWEGSSLSLVWQRPDVTLLVPLGTLAWHLGAAYDISYYAPGWEARWERFNTHHTGETNEQDPV